MNAFRELWLAAIGWLDLIIGRKDSTGGFNATRSGAINAIGFYIVVLLLSMLVPAIWLGMPDYSQLFTGLLINCLPMVGVAFAIWVTRMLLRLETTFLMLFVPAVYALAFVLLAGLLLSFIGNVFSNALLGVLGYMLFREARDIGKMNIGVSLAFAVFGIVALVAPSFAIYMLTVPAPAGV
jgi:hypothetical protein